MLPAGGEGDIDRVGGFGHFAPEASLVPGLARRGWPGGKVAGGRDRSDPAPLPPSDALSSLYEKQFCPGLPFGADPTSPKREAQVLFAYGVQTGRDGVGRGIGSTVERLQLWMLKEAAREILDCHRRIGGSANAQAVSRVYYMEDGSFATLSECGVFLSCRGPKR